MGRFETEWLTRPENLAALTDLFGQWIDRVHRRRPPKVILLDIDSSESPTYGEQEGSAYYGHCGCTCYPCCSCSTSSAISNAAQRGRLEDRTTRMVAGYRGKMPRLYCRAGARSPGPLGL